MTGVTVVALSIAVGLSGCAGSAAVGSATGLEVVAQSQSSPTPTPTPSVTPYADVDPGQYGTGDVEKDMALTSGELVAAVGVLRGYAPQAYPDVYAGLAQGVPGNPDVLRVSLTDLDPAIEADLQAVSGLPAQKIVLEPAYQSERAALALMDRITADGQAGGLDAIDFSSYGPETDGRILFSLAGHDQAQIDDLWARYGPNVRFVTDAPYGVALDGSARPAA